MVGGICEEIFKKKAYFEDTIVETLYFGGGSPSFIEAENIGKIIESVRENYQVDPEAEITIECNPDDIDREFLTNMIAFGINRVSLGVQSFFDEDLSLLNRAHNGKNAEDAIQMIQAAGIQNISIDLIYGLPNLSFENWQKNVQKAIDSGVPHISSYCLTVEEKTLLHHQLKSGIIQLPSDEAQLKQYEYLISTLIENGFDHYEISNFSKLNSISKHNSSYWKNKNYLGFGPSAHSKINQTRFWNISNNNLFLKRLKTNTDFFEKEELSDIDLFNELIMIGLRTKWGVEISELKNFPFYNAEFEKILKKLQKEDRIRLQNGRITIEGSNKFIADTIISDLFVV